MGELFNWATNNCIMSLFYAEFLEDFGSGIIRLDENGSATSTLNTFIIKLKRKLKETVDILEIN